MSDRMAISQAAYHFKVSDRTIRRWIDSGKLPATKIDGQWQITVSDTVSDMSSVVSDIMSDTMSDTVSPLQGQIEEQKNQIIYLQQQVSTKDDQLATKDQQIERLQSALDQSQQLQALTENRYQAEHQQLAEIKGRSLLQRLKAVLVANP